MDIKEQLKAKFLNKYKVVKFYYEGRTPVTLEVHPTYPCNYDCKWCIDKFLKETNDDPSWEIDYNSKDMMSEEMVRKVIDGCVEMGIKGIIISGGGEPTLNKNTELLCELANQNGIVIGLFTNGSMITEKNAKTYIHNCSFIRISFDDYNAENYAATKGVSEKMYDRVISNIKLLVKTKKNDPESKCRIGIDFILTPENVDKMESIYFETLGLGVDYLQFCDVVIPGYEFTQKLKNQVIEELENINAIHKVGDSDMDIVYEPMQIDNDTMCKDCKMTDFIFQVGADGSVEPCPHLARHRELQYGNIKNQSLKDIWDNRPKIETNMFWEYCRFRKQNEILRALKHIEHSELL